MSQEENIENVNAEETTDQSGQENAQEIDNLPIESIGSYARLEELLDDDTAENTSNPVSQS
jgi:hypothetical protein